MLRSFKPFNVGLIIFSSILFCSSLLINLDGEYAPMPPVFFPTSPSPTLLWSWAVWNGLKVFPSADYAEDLRIDYSILEQHAEAYRKIRNTFRYLMGNLNDKFIEMGSKLVLLRIRGVWEW